MFDSPEISLMLGNNATELFSNINTSTNFEIILQSLADRYIPRVSIDLIGPSEINIIKGHVWVGSIFRGNRRRISLNIKPLSNGIFVLTAIINEGGSQIARVPIILRVGQESLSMDLPVIEYNKPILPINPIGQFNSSFAPPSPFISAFPVEFYLKTSGPILCKSEFKTDFVLIIRNISSSLLTGLKIIVESPPQLKIIPNSMLVGSIAGGNIKNRLFSIKPLQLGIYPLTARLMDKNRELASLLLEARIGQEYHYLDATSKNNSNIQIREDKFTKIEANNENSMNCPFCNNIIASDSIFCAICGADLKKKTLEKDKTESKNYCPECGMELPKEAKFCGQCGNKMD